MKKLNVILVYNQDEDKILMCQRTKEPFKGKFNLVGGKVEQNEEELHAAYRELELVEEVNHLYWLDKKENFFDYTKFAGEGNIGHMVRQVEEFKKVGGNQNG